MDSKYVLPMYVWLPAGRTKCCPLTVIFPPLIYTMNRTGHLLIFQAGYVFSMKHCHRRYYETTDHDLYFT